jgi:Na+/melibiose symporter-like transporter
LKTSQKLGYGIGAFGYGATNQTLGSFLMFFGTSVLGISGSLMGIAVGVSTVWDAATDPIVGRMSDNTKSKFWGKRHGFMFFGAVAIAVINLAIWAIPTALPEFTKFLILLVLLLLIETFNTVYSTPYGALGFDISSDYNERTSIQSFKTVFSFLALAVPSLLMSVFLSPSQFITISASADGYKYMSVITSALCLLCAVLCILGTRKIQNQAANLAPEIPIEKPNKNSFFEILRDKQIRTLIVGYAVALFAGAFITSLGLHTFTYTFHFSSLQIPLIMLSLIGGIILGQPIWLKQSAKNGKQAALSKGIMTLLLGAFIFAFLVALRFAFAGSNALLALVCASLFICGVGTGCLYSMPMSIFADLIAKKETEQGFKSTATSAGLITFCTKVSNAFIMFLIGVALDVIGFAHGVKTQTFAVQNSLGFVLVCGVILSCVISNFVFSKAKLGGSPPKNKHAATN